MSYTCCFRIILISVCLVLPALSTISGSVLQPVDYLFDQECIYIVHPEDEAPGGPVSGYRPLAKDIKRYLKARSVGIYKKQIPVYIRSIGELEEPASEKLVLLGTSLNNRIIEDCLRDLSYIEFREGRSVMVHCSGGIFIYSGGTLDTDLFSLAEGGYIIKNGTDIIEKGNFDNPEAPKRTLVKALPRVTLKEGKSRSGGTLDDSEIGRKALKAFKNRDNGIALSLLRYLFDIDPTDIDVRTYLARSLFREGEYEESLAVSDRDTPWLKFNRGRCLMMLDRRERAEGVMRELLNDKPAENLVNMINFWLDQPGRSTDEIIRDEIDDYFAGGMPEKKNALENLKKRIAADPFNPGYRIALAFLYNANVHESIIEPFGYKFRQRSFGTPYAAGYEGRKLMQIANDRETLAWARFLKVICHLGSGYGVLTTDTRGDATAYRNCQKFAEYNFRKAARILKKIYAMDLDEETIGEMKEILKITGNIDRL